MKLLSTPAEISRALEQLLDDYSEYYWAVAWATTNAISAKLLSRRTHIKQLACGEKSRPSDLSIIRSPITTLESEDDENRKAFSFGAADCELWGLGRVDSC